MSRATLLMLLSIAIFCGCYTKKVERTVEPTREVVVHEHPADQQVVIEEDRDPLVERRKRVTVTRY